MADRLLYAYVSDQGTAMAETAFCSDCAQHESSGVKEDAGNIARAAKDWNGGSFHDCTANDALECLGCGYPWYDDPDEDEDEEHEYTVRGSWAYTITSRGDVYNTDLEIGSRAIDLVLSHQYTRQYMDVDEVEHAEDCRYCSG